MVSDTRAGFGDMGNIFNVLPRSQTTSLKNRSGAVVQPTKTNWLCTMPRKKKKIILSLCGWPHTIACRGLNDRKTFFCSVSLVAWLCNSYFSLSDHVVKGFIKGCNLLLLLRNFQHNVIFRGRSLSPSIALIWDSTWPGTQLIPQFFDISHKKKIYRFFLVTRTTLQYQTMRRKTLYSILCYFNLAMENGSAVISPSKHP